MRLVDSRDQIALFDRSYIALSVNAPLNKLVRRRFAIVDRQVGDLITVTLKRAELLFVAVKETTSGTGYHSDIGGAKLVRIAIAPRLFDGLIEDGGGNGLAAVTFSLASMEIFSEREEGICPILARKVGLGDTNPLLGQIELTEIKS